MDKEQGPGVLGSLFDRTGDYLETRADLIKLKAIKATSSAASSIAAMLIMAVFALLIIVLLSVGLSLWLGDLMGRSYYGFFTVAGLYIIAGIVIYSMRKKLVQTPVANSLIKRLID